MRILKNKTAEECTVTYGSKSVEIPANDQADLSESFELWQLAASESLLALLGQGDDKYQLNDGVNDLSLSAAIDLLRGYVGIKTPEGASYVTLLPGKAGRLLIIEGIQFDATADQDTIGDLTLSETREIQGAVVEVANHEKGDYVELLALAPDDSVVGAFANTVYIPPSGKIDPIVSESTVSFPAGFKFRLKYHAVAGGSTREVYVAFRMRHDA
jgi:hypothetical protein